MDEIQYKPLGDTGILVIFGNKISSEINAKVRNFQVLLQRAKLDGVEEIIPAYADVLIVFNPLLTRLDELLSRLKKLARGITSIQHSPPKTLMVPVCYESEFAPDLELVCSKNNLSIEEVIARHTQPDYLIYMMGFTPGFCYLGGMDKSIATPRKETPRVKIPAGAVGIAGEQTGVYPVDSPGGWQIIGRTPIQLFQPQKKNPFPLEQGDYIRFRSINLEVFNEIETLINAGRYQEEFYYS